MALKIANKQYKDKLDLIVKARYEEKLKLISGSDPFQLKNLSTDVGLLPALSYPNIVVYLLFTPSVYTHDDLKNYKSLDDVNQVECGWVSGISSVVIGTNHLVRGQIIPMQSFVMRASGWICMAVILVVVATLLTEKVVVAAPSKTSSRAIAQRLAPAIRHRIEEGHVPPLLMEELVADFEDPDLMDFYDAEKRQFDEYGHMRFGKRGGGDYDDYGHLRFGRSLSGKLRASHH